jgi:hypothetical protein
MYIRAELAARSREALASSITANLTKRGVYGSIAARMSDCLKRIFSSHEARIPWSKEQVLKCGIPSGFRILLRERYGEEIPENLYDTRER